MTSSATETSAPLEPRTRYPTVRNFVGGRFVSSGAGSELEIVNPSDGSLLSHVPLSSTSDLAAAIEAAAAAFPTWSTTPIKERVQVFYRYRRLLEQNLGELAGLISEEHGKIPSEASAEIAKAIELTEFACSLPQIATGEVLEVSRGIECRDRSLSGWGRCVDSAVQLSHHGTPLDHSQCDRAGQLHDPQAVGAGPALCREDRRAAD